MECNNGMKMKFLSSNNFFKCLCFKMSAIFPDDNYNKRVFEGSRTVASEKNCPQP